MMSTRFSRWSAGFALALAGTAAGAPAAAQSTAQGTDCSMGGVSTTLIKIGDETIDTGANARVPNAQECQNGETLTFRLEKLPDQNNLVVYAGETGTDCASQSVRQSEDTRGNCTFISQSDLENVTRREVAVALEEGVNCDTDGVSTANLYFFPSSSTEATEDYTTYGCYRLEVDSRAPLAPTGVTQPRGERQLTVEWEPLGDSTVVEYYVFYDFGVHASDAGTPDMDTEDDLDAGGVANEDCPSTWLREGEVIDLGNLPEGIDYVRKKGMTANSVELDAELLGGVVTPVAVAAVDQARNVGPLSEVVCAEVVDTIGFWEQYKDNGGTAEGGCACSAGPGAGAAGATPIGLVMLGLWWRARRRRA